jgi:GMP synthase (glutamine-hydrolysing)
LIADALGGGACRGERGVEIGVMTLELTDDGRADPVMSHLDGPVPVWHGDTFELPPGADLLARSDLYPHAYRTGSAIAVQSHPEATADMIAGWTRIPTAAAQLEKSGVDPKEFVATVRRAEGFTTDVAARLFGAWAAGLG